MNIYEFMDPMYYVAFNVFQFRQLFLPPQENSFPPHLFWHFTLGCCKEIMPFIPFLPCIGLEGLKIGWGGKDFRWGGIGQV